MSLRSARELSDEIDYLALDDEARELVDMLEDWRQAKRRFWRRVTPTSRQLLGSLIVLAALTLAMLWVAPR